MACHSSSPEGLRYEYLTQLNQTKSPLLHLPAELRNRIYTFAFCNEVISVLPTALQSRTHGYHDYRGPLALRITCCQVYVESVDLFYRNCVFDISDVDTIDKAQATLGRERCKPIESILVGNGADYSILYGEWAPGSEGLLPALKRVHLHPKSVDPQARTWMTKILCDVFGKRELELVADYRAEILDFSMYD